MTSRRTCARPTLKFSGDLWSGMAAPPCMSTIRMASTWNCGSWGEDGMKRSTSHILTTHTGSLPRSRELQELLHA